MKKRGDSFKNTGEKEMQSTPPKQMGTQERSQEVEDRDVIVNIAKIHQGYLFIVVERFDENSISKLESAF